jgi:hypothetical protein
MPKPKSNDDKINMLPLTWVLYLASIGYALIEIAWHSYLNDAPAFMDNMYLILGLNAPGILFLAFGKYAMVKTADELGDETDTGRFKWQSSGNAKFLILLGVCVFLQFMINDVAVIFGKGGTNQVTKYECFFYYVFIGEAEEQTFRVFVCYTIEFVGLYIIDKYTNARDEDSARKIVHGIAILASGITFMAAHVPRYGKEPYMLWAVFFVGLALAAIMLLGKTPTYNIIIHMLYNGFTSLYLLV